LAAPVDLPAFRIYAGDEHRAVEFRGGNGGS